MNLTLKPPPRRDETHFLEFPDTQHLDGQYPNTQPGTGQPQCTHGDRMCEDGSCISGVDLCMEERLMNQNTILIMIVVGLAVVIFLIVLYCFQQRQHSNPQNQRHSALGEDNGEDAINSELCLPPPSYDEVITTNLYPPTPQLHIRRDRITSFDEPTPLTPPPTYNNALIILARSHESVLNVKEIPSPRRKSSQSSRRSSRRSVSMDVLHTDDSRPVIEVIDEDVNKQTETEVFIEHLPSSQLETDVFIEHVPSSNLDRNEVV